MKDTDVFMSTNIDCLWLSKTILHSFVADRNQKGFFSKRKQQQQRSLGLHSEALTDDSYKCRLFYTGIASQSRVLTDEP